MFLNAIDIVLKFISIFVDYHKILSNIHALVNETLFSMNMFVLPKSI